MISILNLTYSELLAFVSSLGEPSFRATQIWQWVWHKRAQSFDVMTNIAKTTRERLAAQAEIRWPVLAERQISRDGTEKLLLQLADGAYVETVLIPSVSQEGRRRITQCLSSQVGCAMGCTFCSTGDMGFVRNMRMDEILGQILVAKDLIQDDLHIPSIRNLVFMGMGEPLLNSVELMRSLEVLNDERGLSFSPRRITVSTCGIEKGLRELGESGLAFLAVSLHAPNQQLREQIMPKAAHWHLDSLMASLRKYPLKTRERVTFEYLLLGGVNDSIAHAKELVRLFSSIKSKLNIILYNPAKGALYKAPSAEAVKAFVEYLASKHVTAIVRKSKGQDIDAACGQLATQGRGKAQV